MTEGKVNQKYKDRLFVWLFGRPERKQNILELYNALNQTSYTDPELLEINTIESAVYITMHNDVSFLLDENMLNLWEEQSTFNPNMPVRGLMYLAQLYSGYIEKHELNPYGETKFMLPALQYIVFYLGRRDEPDRRELKLSDSFPEREKLNFDPCVEMTAIMLNVNIGHNEKLLDGCKVLRDYSTVVQVVRKNIDSGIEPEEAVTKAIDYCIANDILGKELAASKSEVIGMLLTEYDEKKKQDLFQAEGERKGIDRVNRLNNMLLLSGRVDDAIKASQDSAYQEKLFKEMGI